MDSQTFNILLSRRVSTKNNARCYIHVFVVEECLINGQPILFVGAHHLDFRSATKEDPEWVTMQRKQEVQIIQKWIDQYHSDLSSNADSEM